MQNLTIPSDSELSIIELLNNDVLNLEETTIRSLYAVLLFSIRTFTSSSKPSTVSTWEFKHLNQKQIDTYYLFIYFYK